MALAPAEPAKGKEIAVRYVRLGRTSLEVSAIAFGSWAFGPLSAFSGLVTVMDKV